MSQAVGSVSRSLAGAALPDSDDLAPISVSCSRSPSPFYHRSLSTRASPFPPRNLPLSPPPPIATPPPCPTQTVGLYTRTWHHLSASERTVGSLAAQVATLLRGKHKPHFDPTYASASPRGKGGPAGFGDYVVVTDARQVRFTGKKEVQKKYYAHSGYPGGLKVKTAQELRFEKPEEVSRTCFWASYAFAKLAADMWLTLSPRTHTRPHASRH